MRDHVLLSVAALVLGASTGMCEQDALRTVSQIAKPEARAAGAPRHSDVCLSPRWPRKRPGGMPLDAARQFHATRLEWVYLGAAEKFCRQAHAAGCTVCGAVNSNLPDKTTGKPTYEVGRARDLDGKRVLPGFMRDWGCYWGCANNPEFRRIWLDHAKTQVDAGADRIQNDGPRLSEGGMLHWGGCYCAHCVSVFRRYLAERLDAEQRRALGIEDIETFDYAADLRTRRGAPALDEKARARADRLLELFKDFQRKSVLDFYEDVHAKLEAHAGRNVPFSCNNVDGFLLYLHRVHDYAMFEAYPHREGVPDYFYRERVLPFRRLGKSFVTTFVSDDVAHTRSYIAQSYAFGQHVIAPWDVFTGVKSPRVFATPSDSADLYAFVRANAARLDGYEEAAVAGNGLDETRYGDTPPIRLRGGSGQVCAIVRARPGEPDAAVVIHLVEWAAEPEPFTVVLDPRRLFRQRPLRARLVTPAPYAAEAHARAQRTGGFRELTVERECSTGRRTNIDVPPLSPWAMLVVEPMETSLPGLWTAMVWVEPGSYYAKRLRVRCATPSVDTRIHYTLDGSEPSGASPRYDRPLVLEQSTVLRVRAVAADGRVGPEVRAAFAGLADGTATLRPDAPGLAAGLRLWLCANALAPTLNDGDPVTRWTANAGPSAEAARVRLLNREWSSPPVFRTARVNGRPVVEFREPSHHLAIPGFANRYLAGRRFTIFMVSRSDDAHFGFSGNARSGSGGVPRLYVTRRGLNYDVLRPIPTGAPAGVCAINTYMHDGSTLRTWVNGKTRGKRTQTAPVPTYGSGGHLAIPFWSGSSFHAGEMAEIAIFDRALTTAERQGVEAYLAEKYGLRHTPKWR